MDQVVNPKVAAVFVPQVEDLVYNYLGITRKKTAAPSTNAENSNGKIEDLLPTDLEAVSPGSVKSNDDKNESMDTEISTASDAKEEQMEIDDAKPKEEKDEVTADPPTDHVDKEMADPERPHSAAIELTTHESNGVDNSSIPLPTEEIKPENIPPPNASPRKIEFEKIEPPVENTKHVDVNNIDFPKENDSAKVIALEKIELPKELNCSVDIPLPQEAPKEEKDNFFKPVNSDDDDTSSDSSLRRNMSPLTPIRNFNTENSCDAQQAFDNDSLTAKSDVKKEPSSFRFAIESKSTDNGNTEVVNTPKKPIDQMNLAYQFNSQVNINTFNTPRYEESSNSNNLQIDYESDANSKVNVEQKAVETGNSEDCKKERKTEDKRSSSHKSSHRSRDSHKHSSSKDRRSDSKHSTSRDSSKQDKKSKDDHSKSKSSNKESSRDRTDKKDSKESSRQSSSHKSSSHKDSKSHKSSSSSNRHSSKSSDDKKSSSGHRDKSEKSSDRSSKDKPRDSKSSSQRSDRDKKSSSGKSKHDDKDKEKKEKKESDDHYSVSGRGNPNRRSTDRDSNDGSSSSKGSHNPPSSKSTDSKKDAKSAGTKSDNMSTGSSTTSPSDRELTLQEKEKEVIDMLQPKPIVRLDTHLEAPFASPPRVPFASEASMKKPKFANNVDESRKLMKMRKFLDDEQKRMNQEAELLLEFQANVRPSLNPVYSSNSGPELEFACVTNTHAQMKSNDALQIYPDEGFSDHVEDDVPSTLTVREVEESIESINEELNNKAKAHVAEDLISREAYDATDSRLNKRPIEKIDSFIKPVSSVENDKVTKKFTQSERVDTKKTNGGNNNRKRADFEVTIITEELSESEKLSKRSQKRDIKNANGEQSSKVRPEQNNFRYFGENEKEKAELERDRFSRFFKTYMDRNPSKIHLINCDRYEEKVVREALDGLGRFEVVNYQRNGHLKLPKISGNIVKNVNLSTEVSLPCDKEATEELEVKKPVTEAVFSPVKSDCSFELSSDYDARLEEMVNRTSRQEIMEIILGNVTADSPSKMPRIDYFTDSKIDSEMEVNLKRKFSEVETVNNNRHVLTPSKMRRLSASDQISSTTEGKTNVRKDVLQSPFGSTTALSVFLPPSNNV